MWTEESWSGTWGEKDHSKLETRVCACLGNRSGLWRIHVFVAQRVQVLATRFRVSDVCVVLGEEPDEQIFTCRHLIALKFSKDDTMTQMQERIDDYCSLARYVCVRSAHTARNSFTRESMREAARGC
jgi:hypothetical protein